jgi:hypothetical protein
MSHHPVYCTIDLDQSDRYLYLPRGWNDSPWIGTGYTVLDSVMDQNHSRLYVLAHGPIWFDYPSRSYWRIVMPGIWIHPDGLYPHPVTGLWSSKPEHLPIRAERTDYETLRLEAVFGYSVWGGGQ